MERLAVARAGGRGTPWVVVLGLLALAAWVLTALTMSAMDPSPGADPGGFGFYLSTWVVMMAAMMVPSAIPMVIVHASLRASRGTDPTALDAARSAAAFIAGYLLPWAALGILAYGLYRVLRSLDPGPFAWDRGGRYLAGAVLIAAAAYQLTPLKHACLSRCRSPLGFLVTSWRAGPLAASRMGAEYGAWCAGCCWALMATLFAIGVMNVVWMVAIALLIAAEKLLPWRRVAAGTTAVALVVLAAGIAVAPGAVPGLVAPGSTRAAAAMEGMEEMDAPASPRAGASMNGAGQRDAPGSLRGGEVMGSMDRMEGHQQRH